LPWEENLPCNENQIKNIKLFNSYTMEITEINDLRNIIFLQQMRRKAIVWYNDSVDYLIWSAPFSLRKVSIVGPRLMS